MAEAEGGGRMLRSQTRGQTVGLDDQLRDEDEAPPQRASGVSDSHTEEEYPPGGEGDEGQPLGGSRLEDLTEDQLTDEQIEILLAQRQIKARRVEKLRQVRELGRFIETGVVESPIELDGAALPTHKRVASRTLEPEGQKMIKLDVEKFAGKDLQELRAFENACSIHWALNPSLSQSRRIAFAATRLKGKALNWWTEKEVDTTEWSFDRFIEFLRDRIIDPANRAAAATLRLRDMRQAPSQTAEDVLRMIINAEAELPKNMTQEERDAWDYVNCLRPELRAAVLNEKQMFKTRAEVQVIATRHENLQTMQKPTGGGFSRPMGYNSSSNVSRTRGGYGTSPARVLSSPANQRTTVVRAETFEKNNPTTTDRPPIRCHHCGKTGHKKSECRQLKRESQSDTRSISTSSSKNDKPRP